MEQVTFSEFYSLMDIAGIIIVEDTIEFVYLEKRSCMLFNVNR